MQHLPPCSLSPLFAPLSYRAEVAALVPHVEWVGLPVVHRRSFGVCHAVAFGLAGGE